MTGQQPDAVRGDSAHGPAPKARPTIYSGIRMRSRLEADYAAHLDDAGREWEYEPQCFASPDGQWLPDFRWKWQGSDVWHYVELKPMSLILAGEGPDDFVADRINAVLRKMEIALASDPDLTLSLVIWEWGWKKPVMTFQRVPGWASSPKLRHDGWLVRGASVLPVALAWCWE